jgi:hypothetical protein
MGKNAITQFSNNWNFKKWCKVLGVVTVLCIPFNINGHVFTVAGNAVGEKGVYSIFSFFQQSGGHTITIASPFTWQNAGGKAFQFAGITVQNAGNDAFQFAGITVQNVGNNALQLAGIAWQNAAKNAMQIIGIARQNSSKTSAQFTGIAWQNAAKNTSQFIGVSVQKSLMEVRTYFAVGIYQNAGVKTRAFGVWYPLKASAIEGEGE